MKIASFKHKGNPNNISYGVLKEEKLIEISEAFKVNYPSVRHVLEADVLTELAKDIQQQTKTLSLDEVSFVPPVHNPERIFCAGMNYHKRYPLDDAPPLPGNVVLFTRVSGTLVGHDEALEIPLGEAANTFDYEGEIVVVIAKQGRHIKPEDAHDYIAGYTIMNEGSVRAWQKHSVHAGKNFANSGSCGPYMVTADEISNPDKMTLKTRLNDVEVQNTTSDQMIFSLNEIIAYISHTIDLRAGDLIATGSPEGTGASQTPPRFLRSGDVVEVEVSGVGILRNTVSE